MKQLIDKPGMGRVLGLDLSTKSIAFAIIDDGELDAFGKVDILGQDVWEKAADAATKIDAVLKLAKPNYVCIEAAVFVNNRSVIIKLSHIYGAIGGAIGRKGYYVTDVSPLSWGAYIGNPVNSKARKASLKKENPGKSASWLKAEARRRRKQYTLDWVKDTFDVDVDDDDVGDAIAVAWYAWDNNG